MTERESRPDGRGSERASSAEQSSADRSSGQSPREDGERGDERAASREPLPGVPDVEDDPDDVQVPPVSGGHQGHEPTDAKPIRFYRVYRVGERDESDATDDGCGCGSGSSCGCGGQKSSGRSDDGQVHGAGDRRPSPQSETEPDGVLASGANGGSPGVSPDGGTTPANVDGRGNLRNVEFTEPAEDKSQDVYDTPADQRVQRPGEEDLALDTPSYEIRSQMNDIETPEDKTWFMELDEAVIDDDRCIQCGTCVAACPSDSIGIGDDGLPELVKMCTGCSLCWDFCPRGGLRYERQWKITGGDDNVKGAGDPITEFSATVEDDWRENAQDGGLVTAVLCRLLEEGEIDGALIATESDEDPWKAESFLATTPEECIENTGSWYNQTMALGNLNLDQWEHKLDVPVEEASLALVGTPCEIEGIRALQDFEWDYASHESGARSIEYAIALMCTKNFNYQKLMGEKLVQERGIDLDDVEKMDVLEGKMMAIGEDGEMLVEEDVENFHDAALKGCDECADFTGYCADLTVGSVGSSDEYSSVIVRTEQGLDAWNLTKQDLDYHDLEDRAAVGKLQGWDKKKAFDSLERPFDPDAPRFIDYADHAENYSTELNPHEAEH